MKSHSTQKFKSKLKVHYVRLDHLYTPLLPLNFQMYFHQVLLVCFPTLTFTHFDFSVLNNKHDPLFSKIWVLKPDSITGKHSFLVVYSTLLFTVNVKCVL